MPKEDTQFKPGNPGGPGRPPKDRCIPDILSAIGKEYVAGSDQTRLEFVMARVFDYAVKGKSWAVQFIAERTEGKVTQGVDVSGIETMQIIHNGPREECIDKDGNIVVPE